MRSFSTTELFAYSLSAKAGQRWEFLKEKKVRKQDPDQESDQEKEIFFSLFLMVNGYFMNM